MDISFELEGISFAWDAGKADENLRRHAVSFETAAEVFFDPFVQVVEVQQEEGEERTAVIGLTRTWQLLYVVAVLGRTSIRLISAREVSRAQRKKYEDG